MESFDVFVYANGFYRNNGQFVPLEIGFSELNGLGSTHLVTVHWENLEDVFFTKRDADRNYYAERCVHGIPLNEMDSAKKYFMSVDLENLKLFLLAKLRNKKIGFSGTEQKNFLKKYLGISYGVDVQKHIGKLVPDEDAPHYHENFHLENLKKNCAGRIAWTNAKYCREYLEAQNAEETLLEKETEEYWNEKYRDDEKDWEVPEEDKNWIEE